MMGKVIIAGLLGLTLVACASRPQPEELAESWVGHQVADLIDSWGTPDKVEPALGGRSVYSWHAERRYIQPPQCGSTGIRSVGPCTGGRVITFSCDFDFNADAEGQILSASGRGDCLPLRGLSGPQAEAAPPAAPPS